MHTRIKPYIPWLIVLVISIGAFRMGKNLGQYQHIPITGKNPSVQASALMTLTPELAQVQAPSGSTASPAENRELVSQVAELVRSYYVDRITPDKETGMARGIVRGMVGALDDPDSLFLDPSESKLLNEAASGTYHGIGAVLAIKDIKEDNIDDARVTIVSCMPGSPAAAAGLQPGDNITYVDSKWIVSHNPFDESELKKVEKQAQNKEVNRAVLKHAYDAAADRIKGGVTIQSAFETLTTKTTGTVALTVVRPGVEKPIQVKVKLGNTIVDPVEAKSLGNGIEYVRISQFNPRAANEFNAKLKAAGGVKGVIIDVRNNPGGALESARIIATRLIGKGEFAAIQQKNKNKVITVASTAGKLNVPVAVLVNKGTASVAELFAGSLKESISADVVGTTTFGDGLARTPIRFRDGSVAVITTGKMLTSGGHGFEGTGIQPTKVVDQTGHGSDDQLTEAEKLIKARQGRA